MPAYEAYGIKKIIGQNSIKNLTAKALSVANEKTSVKDSVSKNHSEAVAEASGKANHPAKSATRSEDDDDIEVLEAVLSPQKRKKRLTKAQKAARMSSEKKLQAAKRARDHLRKALADDESTDVIVVEPASATCGSTVSPLRTLHERFIVIWKGQRSKFSLLPSESMKSVFIQMATIMESEVDKVLMFCNSDPSHSVSPFDRLVDIGSERLFQAVLKDSTVPASSAPIPAQYKITLNVQSVASKNRIQIDLDRRAPLNIFMSKYCQRMGKKLADFQFCFDGDVLDGAKSADNLDLEGDEVIDALPV